jgi:hypothetical protein
MHFILNVFQYYVYFTIHSSKYSITRYSEIKDQSSMQNCKEQVCKMGTTNRSQLIIPAVYVQLHKQSTISTFSACSTDSQGQYHIIAIP